LQINIHPDIIIPVCIGVPDHDKNIVSRGGIFDLKFNLGLKTTVPGVTRERYIFLESIQRGTGIEKRKNNKAFKEEGA